MRCLASLYFVKIIPFLHTILYIFFFSTYTTNIPYFSLLYKTYQSFFYDSYSKTKKHFLFKKENAFFVILKGIYICFVNISCYSTHSYKKENTCNKCSPFYDCIQSTPFTGFGFSRHTYKPFRRNIKNNMKIVFRHFSYYQYNIYSYHILIARECLYADLYCIP